MYIANIHNNLKAEVQCIQENTSNHRCGMRCDISQSITYQVEKKISEDIEI